MKNAFALILFILIAYASVSQTITKEDYARAVSFLSQNLNGKKVFNSNVTPFRAGDTSGVAFMSSIC